MACVRQTQPHARLIHDNSILHLQHGPIDLLVSAVGSASSVKTAYHQARQAFDDVLTTLAKELPVLRRAISCLAKERQGVSGPVARRMLQAVSPYSADFVTPMAAVAGAVADYVKDAAVLDNPSPRLLVNNGGDIAIYLASGQSCRLGVCNDPSTRSGDSILQLRHVDGVGGVATSGWKGRSHSFGIADAVTVLARDAASADVAATVIANTVDLPGSNRVHRTPANDLQPDTDLGNRLVTVRVDSLSSVEIEMALARGATQAKQLQQQNLIHSASIHLQGSTFVLKGVTGASACVYQATGSST
ncbi:MAG: UPF0280 family protein [Granulosicoccus sp.]